MASRKKVWMYRPPKPSAPELPEIIKADVQLRADKLVETALRPAYVKPPPKDERFNYVVDLYTKWHRHWFYFCAKYACPGPDAVSPFFEARFARMEYLERERFNLAFMRHTGQWVTLYRDLSLEECLTAIKDDPWFEM